MTTPTLISELLVTSLGLRRFPLPPREDNLSSLSKKPLHCTEFVKLEVVSGNGMWKSRTFTAKINAGLPVPLILGLPFLTAEDIIIDVKNRLANPRNSDYNLVNPIIPKRPNTPITIHTPIIPERQKKAKVNLDNLSEPALAGFLLPGPIMAAVRERIEGLAFKGMLDKKD